MKPANIILPCRLPGTDLIVQQLVLYEGGFLEDDSNDEVVDIAGLEIRNTGEQILSSVTITLERDGTFFHFSGSCIPPDATVLLLERDRKQCIYQNFTDCTGTQSSKRESWLREEDLQIVPISMGTLQVQNRTKHPLHHLTLYYKNYLPGADIYVGGITRKYTIDCLDSGQTTEICPGHYARDFSRIFGATAENTPEI